MDERLMLMINRDWAHPALDRAMAVASSWDFWWPILLVALLLVAWKGGFRARAMLLSAGLCIGVVDGIVVQTIKNSVGRPRPHMVVDGVRTLDLARAKPRLLALTQPLRIEEPSHAMIAPLRSGSFPSGHAANNFTIATVVAVFYRRWGWLAFFPAILVSYSRIYVGAHYPVDVLVSCLLGTGLTLLVLAGISKLYELAARRLAPRVLERHPHWLPS